MAIEFRQNLVDQLCFRSVYDLSFVKECNNRGQPITWEPQTTVLTKKSSNYLTVIIFVSWLSLCAVLWL